VAAQPEIGKQLGLVDRRDRFHRPDLNYNLVGDHKVHPVAAIELDAFVNDR
jgi:hypothetical protein